MMSFHGLEITSFMKGRLTMSRWSWFLVYDFEASRSPIEAHIIWIKPYHLNHIISYHITSYHIISQNSSHLVTWHRTQNHPPKPNLQKLPEKTWSQRAAANQSVGGRTAMISHLQKQKKNTKIRLWHPESCLEKIPVNLEIFPEFWCPTVKGVGKEPMEKEKS